MSDSDFRNEIGQLVELQKVDDEIFSVTQDLENAPGELEELEGKFRSVEARRNHVLDKLSHLTEQKKRLINELDDDSAKIKKSKSKLMQVDNQREYQAVMREMDTIEKSNRTREDEKNTLLEELDLQTNNLKGIDEEYEAIKAELDTRRSSLDETLQKGRDRLHKLSLMREDVSRDISRPIFQRYEFIRNRLEHPVIVAVEKGICSGCHIAIPPQSFIELQSNQQILSCPNCQRLIFWDEIFTDPGAVKNVKDDTSPEPAQETIEDETSVDVNEEN